MTLGVFGCSSVGDTVKLVTPLCWLLYDGDSFMMLVIFRYKES